MAAMLTDGFCNGAHHADGATAEYEADAVFRENGTEAAGGLNVRWVCAGPGAAIDTDFLDFTGFFTAVHINACASRLRHRQAMLSKLPLGRVRKGDYSRESSYMKA